jgi:hypothetical protein
MSSALHPLSCLLLAPQPSPARGRAAGPTLVPQPTLVDEIAPLARALPSPLAVEQVPIAARAATPIDAAAPVPREATGSTPIDALFDELDHGQDGPTPAGKAFAVFSLLVITGAIAAVVGVALTQSEALAPPAPAADVVQAVPAPTIPVTKAWSVAPGDTLSSLLLESGLDWRALVAAAGPAVDLSRLEPGDELVLELHEGAADRFVWRRAAGPDVELARSGAAWVRTDALASR